MTPDGAMAYSVQAVEEKRLALVALLEAARTMVDLDSIGYKPAATEAQGSGYPKAIRALKAAITRVEKS